MEKQQKRSAATRGKEASFSQEQAAQMVMNGEMDMEEAEKVIYSAD